MLLHRLEPRLDHRLDHQITDWISDWITGSQTGSLDPRLDRWIADWITGSQTGAMCSRPSTHLSLALATTSKEDTDAWTKIWTLHTQRHWGKVQREKRKVFILDVGGWVRPKDPFVHFMGDTRVGIRAR